MVMPEGGGGEEGGFAIGGEWSDVALSDSLSVFSASYFSSCLRV
jgi:hypothetical protein